MYSLDIIFDSYQLYLQNKSYRKTATLMKSKYECSITRQTIMNWIKKINNDIKKFFDDKYNKFNKNNHNIDNKKINYNIDVINDIKKIVYDNPFVTKNEIINLIKTKYKITLTLNNVTKIYKHLNLTRKKVSYHVVKNEEYLDKLIEKRKDFRNQISKIDINKLISIDESGFNDLNNNKTGLSEKGKKINLPCSEKRIKNNSLICATSVDKIIHYEIHETTVNSDVFYNFIDKLIKNNNLEGYYFMIDNVPFHHCKKTLELITKSNNHYIFTPPYSPNNNPIETIFSIIKNKYKKIKKVIMQIKSKYKQKL